MIAALLRLFALRPFFTMAILGIPVVLLIAVGLFTILALKFIVFVVLPVALVVWFIRRVFRPYPTARFRRLISSPITASTITTPSAIFCT